MPSCFVKSCKSSHRKRTAGVTFHKIPLKLKTEWLQAIGRPTGLLINQQRICSLHFKEEDFEAYGKLKRLKASVVPSQNLLVESALALHSYSIPHGSEPELTRGHFTEVWISSFKPTDEADEPLIPKPVILVNNNASQAESSIDETNQKLTKPVLFQECDINSKRRSSSSDSGSSTASTIKRRRRFIAWMHSYSLSPNYHMKQLNVERRRVQLLKSKLGAALRTSRRRQQTIKHLKEVISGLRKKCLMSNSTLQ